MLNAIVYSCDIVNSRNPKTFFLVLGGNPLIFFRQKQKRGSRKRGTSTNWLIDGLHCYYLGCWIFYLRRGKY